MAFMGDDFHGQRRPNRNARVSAHEMLYDRKLDRAMRSSFAAGFESRWNEDTLFDDEKAMIEWARFHLDDEEATPIKSPILWPLLMRRLLTAREKVHVGRKDKETFQKIHDAIFKVLRVQLDYMNASTTMEDLKEKRIRGLQKLCHQRPLPDLVLQLTMLERKLNIHLSVTEAKRYQIIGKNKNAEIDHRRIRSLKIFDDSSDFQIYLGDHLMSCIYDGKWYLAPRDYYLMLHNKVADLISLLTLAWYQNGVQHSDRQYQITLDFLTECCDIARRYKGKCYAIFKVLEGLVVGETLYDLEGKGNAKFLDSIIDDLYDKVKFDYRTSQLRIILKSTDIPLRHELGCLSKMFGHPFVDMEEGSLDLYSKTNELLELNAHKVVLVACYIKENFIRNYILRKSAWPPVKIEGLSDDHIFVHAQRLNKDPKDIQLVKKFGSYQITDFVYVDLEPCLEFNKLENVIPYLKDKTITLFRSQVFHNYFSDEIEEPGIREGWKDTRLLLTYLLKDKKLVDHIKYITDYENSPTLDDVMDYLVIRIVPKEKELKVNYRGFGCKTYHDRMRALAQERTAMEYLHNFSDEQAMTLTELDLARKLLAFRNMSNAYKGHTILYAVIDASSWNNRFRKETVDAVMKETLDPIYGTSIFGKTHAAYEKSFIYVPDQEKIYSWEGQAGGIEGLNQDTWVITYLGQVKAALTDVPYPYHILCKGDDLRIAFAIPNHIVTRHTLPKIRHELVSTLSKNLSELGHKIKIEESYGSSSYFAFSKLASIGQIEMPQTYRKIQKCYGATNAFLPTLDEYIGSAFSNAHSACKTSVTIIPCYIVALYWSLIYLSRHELYEKLSIDEMVACLLVPSVVGGFPIIYLHNMFVRAESDLLSPFIGLVQFTEQHYRPLFRIMKNFLYLATRASSDLKMLYSDPYAVPTSRPPNAVGYLRKACLKALRLRSKNQDFKALLRATEDPTTENIVHCLATAEPFSVKILSAIYSATPEGILNEVIRKFESARSVMELMTVTLGRYRANEEICKAIKQDKSIHIWRFNRLQGRIISTCPERDCISLLKPCPAESAQIIRETLWQVPISGITMPPIQHLMYYTYEGAKGTDSWAERNHFRYSLRPATEWVGGINQDHFTSGNATPFVGHTTRIGTIAPQVEMPAQEGMLLKVKNLIDLAAWTNHGQVCKDGNVRVSNLPELIDHILGLYTNKRLKDLDPITAKQRGTGTVQHHVRAPSFRESIVPNTLINLYTRFVGESDTHQSMRARVQHYLLNFLHVYCYSLWTLTQDLEYYRRTDNELTLWGVTTPCDYCANTISEDPVHVNLKRLGLSRPALLNITTMGQVAIHALESAVEDLQGSGITAKFQAEYISYRNACIGVLQELMNISYYRRVDVSTRYGSHGGTAKAYSILSALVTGHEGRIIGITELKRMPNDLVADYLITVVASYFALQHSEKSLVDIMTYLETEDPVYFPWYGLLDYIAKAGKLPAILQKISQMGGTRPPILYNNTSTVSKYIGVVAIGCTEIKVSMNDYIWLSNYAPRRKIDYLCALLSRTYRDVCIRYLEPLDAQLHADDVNQKKFVKILKTVMVKFYLQIEYTAEDIVVRIERDHPDSIQIAEDTEIDYFEWYDLWTTEYETAKNVYSYLFRNKHLEIPDDNFAEDVQPDELEDAVTSLRNQTRFLKKNIVYSNLSACVTKIRSETTELEHDDDYGTNPIEYLKAVDEIKQQAAMHLPDNERYFFLMDNKLNSHKWDKWALTEDWVGSHDGPDPLPIKYPDELWWVRPSAARQLIGSITGSEGYMLEILDYLGIMKSETAYPLCLALSDGAGGLTSGLLTHFPNARVIFHTYEDDVRIDNLPPLIRQYYPEKLAQVDTCMLDHGHYKLELDSTWEYLKRNLSLPHIVYSDIEMSEQRVDIEYRNTVYRKMLGYALSKLHDNGIFILRISSYHIEHLAKVISYAYQGFSQIDFYSPPSMKTGHYLYMIVRHPKNRDLIIQDEYCLRCNRIARQICQSNTNIYMSIYRHRYNQITPTTSISPIMQRTIPAPLTNRACNILSSVYMIPIGPDVHEVLWALGVDFQPDWSTKLYQILQGYLDCTRLLDEMIATVQIENTLTDWREHFNTLTHRALVFDSYCRRSGLLYGLSLFCRHQMVKFSYYDVDLGYQEMYNSLPDSCKFGAWEDHKNRSCEFHQVPITGYHAFCRGFENAMTIWNSASIDYYCEQKQIARQG